MKVKLNQIEFRSNKVQNFYKLLLTDGDEDDENLIPKSFGFSKHFGESL